MDAILLPVLELRQLQGGSSTPINRRDYRRRTRPCVGADRPAWNSPQSADSPAAFQSHGEGSVCFLWTQDWTQTTSDRTELEELDGMAGAGGMAEKPTQSNVTLLNATAPIVFQDRCLKPLGHPSVLGRQRLSRGVRPGKASNRAVVAPLTNQREIVRSPSRKQKPADSSTAAPGWPWSGQEIRWRPNRGCA